MNIKRLAIVGTLATTFSLQAVAETNSPNIDVLTGDARTACEVILCLSSAQGKGISECKAPLRKYFSIRAKKWHKTLAKRRAFLDLCPAANENAKMSALTTAMQHQEYACDAETLNSRTETRTNWIRRSKDDGGSYVQRLVRTQSYMPKFCEYLYNHEFTEYSQIKKPKYTCDANKWYSRSDWNRGYEGIVVSRKWNRYNEEYDVVYKDVPIKKDCWQ
ncbi:TrbM/KikA/MpfK family conjugal transfer protein [Histophilus somni]|uniref:TrbM/KikA/MpfK family conjugal transfer protein n=1 Tax=Histophilus somni TaxID=731 RepID=UPI00201E7D14|nr:TrbM/KikA/MpfK family conjugal transfer protein [Histophilus somni]